MVKYIQKTVVQCLAIVTALFVVQNVMAATVYQWTDEEGVVHFSDIAPKGKDTEEIEEIEFADYGNSEEGDRYSISNQLERMTEWRRQLTEERLAQKQLQLEARRVAQEQDAYRYNNSPGNRSYYEPSYYYPPAIGYSYPAHIRANKFGHGHRFRGHHSSIGGSFTGKAGGNAVFKSKIDMY